MENNTVELEEFNQLPEGSCQIIDIREPESMSYGLIPGSQNIQMDILQKNIDILNESDTINGIKLYRSKKIVVYCKNRIISKDAVSLLCD